MSKSPGKGWLVTPKGDRVGIISPTDTEFDRKDKDAHPSDRLLAWRTHPIIQDAILTFVAV